MKEESFITAENMAGMLKISKGHTYKVIHKLNEELEQQ